MPDSTETYSPTPGDTPSRAADGTTAPGGPALAPFTAGDEPVLGYRLVQKLGKGGFGEVWSADGPGGFRVAFKFVPLGGRAGATELRALDVIRNVRHPNLLSVFGAWQANGWLAIGMELADRTLADRLDEALRESLPGIPRGELLRYALEAAAVIDYLNKPRHFLGGGKPVGIQHGDVKPQNLLLVGRGLKVGDFGLVRLLEREVVRCDGGLTLPYAAPEILGGSISRWSDQFALAVTYCYLRGGKLPFTSGDRSRPPDLTMVPEPERAVIGRALEPDPRKRWPSCRAFVKALASGRPPGPEPAEVPPAPPPPPPAPVAPTATETATAAPTMEELFPGIQLVRPVGRGAMATLYEAVGPGGMPVAVRILPRRLDSAVTEAEKEALERIEGWRHPHLLTTFAARALENQFILVTEWADSSLNDRLRECQGAGLSAVPATELVRYCAEAAEALDYLHDRGELHRNVKPSNLLLVAGRIRVADAGMLALQMGRASEGVMAGTPQYMAPEVWQGRPEPASDQYALAVTYAELRLGRPVFAGKNLMELAQVALESTPDLGTLPAAEQEVLLRALAKDPRRRFVSCGAFVRALARAIESQPAVPVPARPHAAPRAAPAAAPSGMWQAAPRDVVPPKRRSPTRFGLLVAAAAALLWGLWLATGAALGRGAGLVPLLATGGAVVVVAVTYLFLRRRRRSFDASTEPLKSPAPPPRAVSLDDEVVEEVADEFLQVTPRAPAPTKSIPAQPSLATATPEAVPEPRRFEGHTDAVWCIAVSLSGDRILSGGLDGTVRLWDVNAGRALWVFEGHGDGVSGVAFLPGRGLVVSAGLDGTLRLCDAQTGAEVRRWDAGQGRVFAAAASPGGRRVASGGEDGTVRLWDPDTGTEVHRLAGHSGWVTGVGFSSDGKLLLSVSEDGTARLWGAREGEEVRRFEGHKGPVKCAAFAPGGGRAVTAGEDGTVRLWDLETGRELWRFTGHTDWVRSVAFSPDGASVLSAGDDETLRLLAADAGGEVLRLDGPMSSFLSVAFAPHGRQAITGGDDGAVRLWDLDVIHARDVMDRLVK